MVQTQRQSGHVKFTITLACLLLLTTSSPARTQYRPKREAGFYTTRFGRSDPLMRFREARTSFVPESFPLERFSNKPLAHQMSVAGDVVESGDVAPTLLCEFSPRKQFYTCHPRARAQPSTCDRGRSSGSVKKEVFKPRSGSKNRRKSRKRSRSSSSSTSRSRSRSSRRSNSRRLKKRRKNSRGRSSSKKQTKISTSRSRKRSESDRDHKRESKSRRPRSRKRSSSSENSSSKTDKNGRKNKVISKHKKKDKKKKIKKKDKIKDVNKEISEVLEKRSKKKKKHKKEEKQEVRKGPMTKEEWERLEKIRRSTVLPDPDCKRQHYDANKRKEAAEYSWVLSGSPPPPHVRAAYKTFKKPQGF